MVGAKGAAACENLQGEGRGIQVNAQSAAQFKDVGQTKLAYKKRQKKLRYWRKIFARSCNKISFERRIRSYNSGKEAR